jgi:hypothetical protein
MVAFAFPFLASLFLCSCVKSDKRGRRLSMMPNRCDSVRKSWGTRTGTYTDHLAGCGLVLLGAAFGPACGRVHSKNEIPTATSG